ncbi:ABC transporter ATP-binding protein [Alicyclobacillus sp. SO9]|uniref:ABC transporter ATP-binding protein n=1 Tax=Alicyclobacillus sp. SO9 TaxID=2665646 RepID=UPI0018E6E1C1|nr:ABC transporter ATP-binding protein [Alicyclobacillus sp. SO9]QQE77517.1 ABC transporter ATP-binding protein [Alicyclobacillus sp. SO9]
MEIALSVDSLSADIGQFSILRDVSFQVPVGSVTVLLGRNGAGKTTTLRTLMGFIPIKSGSVQLFGRPLGQLPPHRVQKAGVAYVPEDNNIFSNLTVEENLRLAAGRGPLPRDGLEYVLALFPDLRQAYNRLGGTLSGGQRQMLAIASVLMARPKVLLIDEPTKGLSPLFVEKLVTVIQELGRSVTVLLVEQNLYLAEQTGTYYVVLDDGKSIAKGPVHELREDKELQQRALGIRVAVEED